MEGNGMFAFILASYLFGSYGMFLLIGHWYDQFNHWYITGSKRIPIGTETYLGFRALAMWAYFILISKDAFAVFMHHAFEK